MIIESYQFGRMVVDGREYSADLILYPDRIDPAWWRREGHRLDEDDLSDLLASPPEALVIGTGRFGRMAVPEAVREALLGRGLDVRVAPTPEAVGEFNELRQRGRRVAGAFHLTC